MWGIDSVAFVPDENEFYVETRITHAGPLKLVLSRGLKAVSKKQFKDYEITEIEPAD